MENQELHERLDKLELRLERAEAAVEIQNLLAKYELLQTACMHDEQPLLFAQKAPDVSFEIYGKGIFVGIEKIREQFTHGWSKLYQTVNGATDHTGHMVIHMLTSPLVEVAGDCNTAKGIWLSPGVTTRPLKDRYLTAWAWLKYGADFIREDSEWKIWHLHIYSFFTTPYEKNWVENSKLTSKPPVIAEEDRVEPTRPSTHFWTYRTDATPDYTPTAPGPYETWDNNSMCKN